MSNYPASRNCSWIITVPSDKHVKLAFTELALGSCELNCSSDSCTYVEIYDGSSPSSPSLGRFCNGSVVQDVFSSGNQMFVKFRSGSSLDRGFQAQYSVFLDRPTTTPTPSPRITEPPSEPTARGKSSTKETVYRGFEAQYSVSNILYAQTCKWTRKILFTFPSLPVESERRTDQSTDPPTHGPTDPPPDWQNDPPSHRVTDPASATLPQSLTYPSTKHDHSDFVHKCIALCAITGTNSFLIRAIIFSSLRSWRQYH